MTACKLVYISFQLTHSKDMSNNNVPKNLYFKNKCDKVTLITQPYILQLKQEEMKKLKAIVHSVIL